MTALLAAELHRLLVRRLVRATAAAAIVAIAAAAVAVLMASHPAGPAELRSRAARHQQALDRCVASGFNPPVNQLDASDRREFCANEALPAPPLPSSSPASQTSWKARTVRAAPPR